MAAGSQKLSRSDVADSGQPPHHRDSGEGERPHPTWPAALRRLAGRTVPLLLAAVLLETLVPLPAAAVAALGGLGSAWFPISMIRRVLAGRAASPTPRTAALAGGALLTALAAGASGVAAMVAPDVLLGDVPLPAELPLIALFIAAAAYLFGVLRPPQPRGPLARLRVGLDGASMALALVYTPWLLIFSAGDRRGAAITAILFGGCAVATSAAAGPHAVRHRACLRWCAPGSALSLAGLTALVVAMDHPGEANAALAACAAAIAINGAAAMIWYGTLRVHPESGTAPRTGTDPVSSYPLLALLLVAAALATAYHLVNGRSLDPVSIILGVSGVVVVAAREYTAALCLRRHAEHLADQGNRLRNLVFGSSDVALILDDDLAVRWQSPAAARQFGLSDQDVIGRPADSLVHAGDAEMFARYLTDRMERDEGSTATGGTDPDGSAGPYEVRLRDGFGRWRVTEWTVNGPDPASPGRSLVVHVRDVSERHDLERTLRHATYLDRQTSLVNQRGLRRANEPGPGSGALIAIELTGLPAIADVYGADVAETVLVEAARRLRTETESPDVPARLGETRFAVLTRSGAVRAHLLANRLLNALTAPYTTPTVVAHLSAYAGLADLTAEADIDEVIRHAGLALRSIGPGRPGAVEWYDQEMEIRLLRRSALEQSLPHAISRNELDLIYQPIVRLPDGRPVGVEALLRWRHHSLGTVPPAELLPVAEDLGLLGEVGQWVMHWSCRQLSQWRRDHPDLWLAVNVCPRQLSDPAFLPALTVALAAHQIPPDALVIEVAERDLDTVRDDPDPGPTFHDVAGQLGELRALGVRTAVDNFGTGPTSLSQLRRLPIDLLKIDREVFGVAPARTRQLGTIIDVVVTLGRQLGIEVIAQGLETPADLDTVRAAGCDLGQGHLLGRPVPPEYVEVLLDGHRTITGPDA